MAITIRKIACPEPPVGATLMKTGQTTSYRTGDDGDLEEGRDTDFFTLAVNNPFGNTNRFTDELGGSAYVNGWMIDWSTYDVVAGTVLGWYINGVRAFRINWNDAIDFAFTETFGTFSGCRLPNKTEAHSIINHEVSLGLNYSPWNLAVNREFWTSTTNPTRITQSFTQLANGFNTAVSKTGYIFAYAVRTFTVSGTTLT